MKSQCCISLVAVVIALIIGQATHHGAAATPQRASDSIPPVRITMHSSTAAPDAHASTMTMQSDEALAPDCEPLQARTSMPRAVVLRDGQIGLNLAVFSMIATVERIAWESPPQYPPGVRRALLQVYRN